MAMDEEQEVVGWLELDPEVKDEKLDPDGLPGLNSA